MTAMTATFSTNAFLEDAATYSYTCDRDFIITEAFRKVAALGDGETIDATRLTIGSRILNPMVKSFASFGLNIWTLVKLEIRCSEWSQNPSIVIGPSGDVVTAYKPLKLHEATRKDGDVEIPLTIISNKEYVEQTDKSTTGVPSMIYYKPETTYGELFLWQPPNDYWNDNGTIVCTFQRQIKDISNSTDLPDFPAEWHEALIYQLAVRLAPNYGLSINDRQMLKEEADRALSLVLASDQEEGSLFITPNRRY